MKINVTYDPFTLEDSGEDCVTLDGFSTALHRLLNAAWGHNWGVYSEEEPMGNEPDNLDAPQITFALDRRVISEELKAYRKKLMDVRPDPDNPGFNINIYQRLFRCRVSWRCWHKTKRGSRIMLKKLEWFLENYIGYFKEHGLVQMKFFSEERPMIDKTARRKIPCATLKYDIWIVETEIVRDRLLNDLNIKVNNYEEGEFNGI